MCLVNHLKNVWFTVLQLYTIMKVSVETVLWIFHFDLFLGLPYLHFYTEYLPPAIRQRYQLILYGVLCC